MSREKVEQQINEIYGNVLDKHESLTRSLALIREMQAVPGADPALEFIAKSIQKAQAGTIDVIKVAGLRAKPAELFDAEELRANMHKRSLIIRGLKGLMGLDYGLDANPVPDDEALAAREWLTEILEHAENVQGYSESLGAPPGWQAPEPKGMGDYYKESISDDDLSTLSKRGCTPFIQAMDDSPFQRTSINDSPYAKRDPSLPDVVHVIVGYGSEDPLRAARGILNQYKETYNRIFNLVGYAENTAVIVLSAPVQMEVVKPTLDEMSLEQLIGHVKQMQEDVAGSRDHLGCYANAEGLDAPLAYLEWHLKQLQAPRADLKPVLELKKAADVMRSIIKEERKLPGHVVFDLKNMADSLDLMAAKHIGEDVTIRIEGEDIQSSRTAWAHGVLLAASTDHPLDISQTDLRDAASWLESIIRNNPGFINLGKEGYIIIPSSANVPEVVIDSIRQYLTSYGGGEAHNAETLRGAAARAGSVAITNMPEWFATTYGHVSKGGFANLLYHTMTSVASQDKHQTVYISSEERKQLEADLRSGKKFAWPDFLETATKSDADE